MENCSRLFHFLLFFLPFIKGEHNLFVLYLLAKRLKTYKELDSDGEDWAKHLSLPSNKGAEKVSGTWTNTTQPLRRSQSARARFQGHKRNRSLGTSGNCPFQVAFSSTIVSKPSCVFKLWCCIWFMGEWEQTSCFQCQLQKVQQDYRVG